MFLFDALLWETKLSASTATWEKDEMAFDETKTEQLSTIFQTRNGYKALMKLTSDDDIAL